MNKKTRKPRVIKKAQAEKPRRGRPRKTEAEKAADPLRAIMAAIKSDLKRIKKSKKRLEILWGKFQDEQSTLLNTLLESLEKIKTDLKKKPRKGKKGKRGRPSRKPVRKPGRKPTRKPSRKPGRKLGRPSKKIEQLGKQSKKKIDDKNPSEKKPQIVRVQNMQAEKLVVPIPKPGKKAFRKSTVKITKKTEPGTINPESNTPPDVQPDIQAPDVKNE
jgi:hypothetical protein